VNPELVWLAVLEEFMARNPALNRDLTLIAIHTPSPELSDFAFQATAAPANPDIIAVEVTFNPAQPPARLALHLSNALLAFRRHCFATAYDQSLPTLPYTWTASAQDQENFQQTLASTQPLISNTPPPAFETPPSPPPPTPEQRYRDALDRRLYHGVDQAAIDAKIDAYLQSSQSAPPATE
jgi:hypothetical protein